jgi:VIT1/CCC1 family predicted Fe2+/Mn2+ transporter
MNAETGKGITPKPVLTFSEGLHHYFAIGNELYEAKARGDKNEMTDAMQGVVDSLRASLAEGADVAGVGAEFRAAMNTELGMERRSLWLRTTASKLKAARPGLLSLELVGSAGVVVLVAYYVFHLDAFTALLLGLVLVGLRLALPWVMDKLATNQEQKLRRLRRLDSAK